MSLPGTKNVIVYDTQSQKKLLGLAQPFKIQNAAFSHFLSFGHILTIFVVFVQLQLVLKFMNFPIPLTKYGTTDPVA